MTNDRLRILLVGPLPEHLGSRSTGGIATHVLELAEALASLGHHVAVYADNMPPAVAPNRQSWGETYSALPLSRSMRGLFITVGHPAHAFRTLRGMGQARALGKRFGPVFAQVLGLSRAMKGHRPQVVHFHQPDMRVLYARLAGLNRLATVNTLHSLSAFAEDAPAALSALVLDNLRWALATIAVSNDVAQGLTSHAPELECAIIPNGVDLVRFSEGVGTQRGHDIAYIGRIAAGKGIEDLLGTVRAVRKRVPDARLLLAGPIVGLDIETLMAERGLPEESVTLLGGLDRDGVAAVLASAGVFALPSRLREGQPRAVIEALAAGCPVVATDVGGIPDLLSEGAGLLVQPGDVDALADSLSSVLTDADLARKLSRRGVQRAEQYDVVKTTEHVVAEYMRAIARASR